MSFAQLPPSTLSFGTPSCTSIGALVIGAIEPEKQTQINLIDVAPICTSAEAMIHDADEGKFVTVAEQKKQSSSGIRFVLLCFACALIFSSVLSFVV